MKKRIVKRLITSVIALFMIASLLLPDATPFIQMARDFLENTQIGVDFGRPDSLGSLDEVGIKVNSSQNTEKADTGDDIYEVILKNPKKYYNIEEELDALGLEDATLVHYDKYSHTYLVEEDKYTTVLGGSVATYTDTNGKTQLIDNTLIESEIELESGKKLTGVINQENSYTVMFPNDITQENGITVTDGDYQIELIPLNGDYSHYVIKDNTILYNSVYADTDIQYTLIGNRIKEDIILLKPVEKAVYEYRLNIPGLTAEKIENQMFLYPQGKTIEDVVYVLSAPYMEDAAGQLSMEIEMELTQKDGETILSVIPDKEWLQSEERQYPVCIDPSISSVDENSNINFEMYGVEEGNPEACISDAGFLYVGYDDGIVSGNLASQGTLHRNCRVFIKVDMDMSIIPEDAKISSATFSVANRTTFSKGKSQFALYTIDAEWPKGKYIFWTKQPETLSYVGVQTVSDTKHGYMEYDVTTAVNNWVSGVSENYGFAIKGLTEAATLDAAQQCEILNSATSSYPPILSIEWTSAEDPFLADRSLDDTTIEIRTLMEKNKSGLLKFDGFFVDGLATSGAIVEYTLFGDGVAVTNPAYAEALGKYAYPNSTDFTSLFPNATKYDAKSSNWQSTILYGLNKDTIYQIKASAYKEIDGVVVQGKEAVSDSFVIYEVQQFDTLPKIAKYYGVSLDTLMKDNSVQDTLVVAGNTLFIRNPQTAEPYTPGELSDEDKKQIDGALMGRGLHCEFGFEPINLNTGNFYMDQVDTAMNEFGGEFTISRTYNSLGAGLNSVFGRGWSFYYDHSLSMTEEGNVIYKRGDGSFLIFTKNEDDSYHAPAGYSTELTQVVYEETLADGTKQTVTGWQITDAEQSKWEFDKYGLLKSVVDVDGFVTKFVYDEDYNLSKIITPSEKEYNISFNNFGYITKIILPNGKAYSYTYDENGNLIGVTNPNGYERTYQYDDSHQMISWVDENGNTVIVNVYDAEGRVIKQTDANGRVATLTYGDNTTTTVDNEGNKTIYQYDDQHRTTAITYPDGSTCYKSYNSENQLVQEQTVNGIKTYTYDEWGNIATETREDGATAVYKYNNKNKLLSVTGFDGGVVSYEYDEAGNMVTYTQADGNKVTYEYDSLHRMISQTDGRGNKTTYTYDGPNLISYKDAEGHTWSFTYDAMNRQVTMSDPLGNTTSITYDNNGNKTSTTAPDGGRTTYQLDALGNILTETNPLGHKTFYTYDKMYNILEVKDALGNCVTYKYDKNGKQIQSTDAKGHVITYTRDSMGRVVKEESDIFGAKLYEYDLAGNLITVTDGEGNVTVSEYNTQGKVIKITDALGNVTQYTYNALGQETKITYADGSTDVREYDASGRVIKQVNALGAVILYTYDASGNILTMIDDAGRTYTYAYDKNNNKIKEINPEGGVSLYTYDAAGRKLSYTNAEGQTETYTYDAAGRVISVVDALGRETKHTYDLNGNLLTSSDAKGAITSYTYDALGNMTSITDPMGNITAMKYDELGNLYQTIDSLKGIITYEYDAMGNLLKMTDALGGEYLYTYDKNGKNTSLTGPQDTKSIMKYDANGQLVYMEDAAGLKVNYEYDAVGCLLSEKDNAGNETYYTYDAAGNILTETDQLERVSAYTYDKYGHLLKVVEPNGSITTYAYDVMGRVSSVTDAEGTITTFTYDKVGNQLSMKEGDGAEYRYTYDAGNRLISTTDPMGNVEKYVYDENNNPITYTDKNGKTVSYTYDANDNMLTITDGNGGITTYKYDELNRLIAETSPEGDTIEYRYDALGNLTKYKDATGAITQYKYDALGNMVETISPKGKSTTYTYDKHGNVLTITDPLGNVTTSEYNLNDQVTKLVQPNGGIYTYAYDKAARLEKVTSPLGFVTSFTYDLADNVIKETTSLGQTTEYTYDKLHRMTSSINANGGTSSFAYDIRGNLTSETNALGYTNTYAYDVLGRLVEEKNPLEQTTQYTYDPVGNLESVLTPGKAKTTYSYDANYNVTAVADPLGNVTTYAYDKNNRLTKTTDALEQTESTLYDANNRVTAQTDKAGNTTQYAYDIHGNVQTVTDRTGLNTHYRYDANDNMTEVEDASGNKTTYSYDSMGWLTTYVSAMDKVTTYTYDLEGNQTSRTDATGRKETYEYDAAGRLIAYTSAGGNVTRYDYDALNQLIEKSYENAKGEAREDAVLYGYDALGQRISMSDTIGDAVYQYDALGRVISATDSAGQKVTYTYDADGNLTSIGYPDGSTVAYGYDLNGNLTSVTDGNGDTTYYKYDALNRMVETIRPNNLTTYVTYDVLDHITKLETRNVATDKVVSTYTYTYNEEGYVVSEVVEEAVASEELEKVHGNKHVHKHLTDALHANCKHHNHDIKHQNCKDPKCKHHHCDHKNHKHDDCVLEGITITTEYKYYYDSNWQLTKCTEIGEYVGTTTYEYSYDEDGNRTRYTKTADGTTETYIYTYNDANQLVSSQKQSLWGEKATHYTYDADGNLISEKTGQWETTYEYTAENRLSVVRQQGMVLMAALYDGDGNRLFTLDYTGSCTTPEESDNCGRKDCIFHDEKQQKHCMKDKKVWIPDCGKHTPHKKGEENSSAEGIMKELASLVSKHAEKNYTITQYVNDITLANEEVLAELDVKGNVTSTYTYGFDRLSHETKTQSGKKVTENTGYYLYNGLDSVTGIASDAGVVQATYTYDPYGNLTAGEPAQVNFYGYNGESTNTLTGLQYLRARYYDMSNGNFITEDTYAGQTSDPSTLNRYIYVSNNPVNREDPSGHSWLSKVVSGAKKLAKDAGNAITKTVKKVADDLVTTGKKVLNTVSETAKKVGTTIKNTVNKVIHAVTHPAETIEKVNKAVQETKEKVVSEGKKLVKTVSNKVQNLGETITEAKTYVAKKAAEVHEKVKKTLCTTTNRIKEQLGKVDWASVGKIVAGGAIIAGLGVATVLTGGVVGAVAAGALAGAAVNGGIGAVVGGVTSAANGGTFLEGAANGFLAGTLTGAITGALTSGLGFVGGILKNPLTQNIVESAVDTVTDTVSTIAQGGDVSAMDMLGNFAFGAVTGLDVPGGNKVDDVLDAVNTTQTKKAVENFEEGVEELAKNKQVKETLEEIGESGTEIKYSPVNPGPLSEDVANSFNGATYTERVLTEDTVMYRVSGGKAKEVGSYMSMTPQGGGLQSQLDLALNPAWGNTTENVTKVVVPKETTIYEGIAAPQNMYDSLGNVMGTLPGGGNQVYIPTVEEGWFQ